MKSVIRRFNRTIYVLLLLGGIAAAFPAQAAYQYTTIDYPGALCTSVWGINNSGDVLGTAAFSVDCSGTAFAFVYQSKKGTITVLPTVPGAVATGAIGINQAGLIVGSAGDGTSTNDVGFILDKGAFTFFAHPGSLLTQGRAIGNSGVVTGYSIDSAGINVPFIYDPKHNTYIDFTVSGATPGFFNVAQGINGKGDVVGSFRLDPDAVFPGSLFGPYGFLRDKRGVITLFRVNGYRTRARGITESGRIAGFLTDDALGEKARGFVVTLTSRGGFQSLTVSDADLLDVPGSVLTIVEGINDVGLVSGGWIDANGVSHGFLATPSK